MCDKISKMNISFRYFGALRGSHVPIRFGNLHIEKQLKNNNYEEAFYYEDQSCKIWRFFSC